MVISIHGLPTIGKQNPILILPGAFYCPTKTNFFAAADAGQSYLTVLAGSAESVVDDGLRALQRNQAFIVSGLMNKIFAQGGRISPRAVTRRVAAMLNKS